MPVVMVDLTPKQKEGLVRRARARKTTVADEIRSAIDAYLADTPGELELLDAATRRAKEDIDATLKTAEGMLADHRLFMRELERLRGKTAR